MNDIIPNTQKLIHNYYLWQEMQKAKEGVTTIHVDEVISRLAASYEKVREVTDWQEEHLMRRIAIERILKRRMFLKEGEKEVEKTAEFFVLELIRDGHFPNDKVPKSKIKEIRNLMIKYDFLLENCPSLPKDKTGGEFYAQILGIAACEVEEILDEPFYFKTNILVEFMESMMKERIKISKRALELTKISQEEKDIQIYIAVQQAAFKLDESAISYNILKRRWPKWFENDPATIEKITDNIFDILAKIEKDLSHPLLNKFYKVCEQYDTPYLLLGDVLSENAQNMEEEIIDEKFLQKQIKKVYKRRLGKLRKRSFKSAFFSTVSIFLSNIFVLFAVEIPFTRIVGKFNPISKWVDVLFPTFLMAVLVSTIKLPDKKNLKLVIEEVKKIVYQKESRDVYEIDVHPPKNFLAKSIIIIFYIISSCISFGSMFIFLYHLNYPPFSYLIMYIFTSLIAFTGVRIRERARELNVGPVKESIFHFISDPFVIPVLRFGEGLSNKWKKFNIVSTMFNFAMDTPILTFVEFLEQWRYFLGDKKESIH